MIRRLLDSASPLHQIASELKIIRELMELELASREPPIIRVTEEPSKNDTTVYMPGDEEKKPSALTRARELLFGPEDEDEDVSS